MEKVYAQVLTRLHSQGKKESELYTHLLRHLKEKGRLKLLPKIKRELERMNALTQKEYGKLEVANTKETAGALKELKSLGVEVHGSQVNHALIRGWRTVQGGALVDRSAKQELIHLYQNIVRS